MLLSPGPARPKAHDGDTGAQSVSSRGESWLQPTGIPAPARLCPPRRLAPARSFSRPAPAAGSQLLPSVSDCSIYTRASGNLGLLQVEGWAGGRAVEDQTIKGPAVPWAPRVFVSATDGSLPEECLSYSVEALVFLCLLRGWGG